MNKPTSLQIKLNQYYGVSNWGMMTRNPLLKERINQQYGKAQIREAHINMGRNPDEWAI